jgi:hypothetical protein
LRVSPGSGRNGRQWAGFFADGGSRRGGVHVRGQDLDGDRVDELVTETRHGNKQMVRAFDLAGRRLRDFAVDVEAPAAV